MKKIGLLYVKGAVPALENFGNLPTDLIKSNGLLNGNQISKELDALIIPGGSLIESGDISDDLKKEIIKIARDNKPIIGICAGFQLLSNKLDVGDDSENTGLGLIDAHFSPLTLSEHLKAEACPNSFLTKSVIEDINGYHTHSFGKVETSSKPLFYSKSSKGLILSGACNDDGNVIGTMIHNLLDENQILVDNLLEYIDVKDIDQIHQANKEVKKQLNQEIGINSNIQIANENIYKKENGKAPKFLMISSTSSFDKEGKSFLTIGLAGALRKRGLNVGLLKIGSIVTDLIPAFYLTKGSMESYTSINGGYGGWVQFDEALANLKNSNYDVVLIEGMGSMTNFQLMAANTDFKIANENNIPVILITSLENDSITGALYSVKSLNQENIDLYGKKIKAALFNKVNNYEIKEIVEKEMENTNIDNRFYLPKIEEVSKLKYDIYSNRLLEVIEENIEIEKILKLIY